MPLYDYVCESCGTVVEVMHAISASGPTTCDRCGGAMKRALSAPAIVFKGSGWAKKDARDAGRSKAPATPATTGSEASTGGDGGGTATDEGVTTGAPSSPAPASSTGGTPTTAPSSGTSGGSSAATG